MKKISTIMAALFCLAACDKQEVTASLQDIQEDVYEIVLNEIVTKGSAPASVDLQIGSKENQTLTATLLKNGEPVSGATFSWNDPMTGGYYSGTTQNNNTAKHKITAIKAGSGSSVCVTGYEGGKARATSSDIEVIVASAPVEPEPDPVYNFGIDWSIIYPDNANISSSTTFPDSRTGLYYVTIPDWVAYYNVSGTYDAMTFQGSLTGTGKCAATNWEEVRVGECQITGDIRDPQVTTSSGVVELCWVISYSSKEVAEYHFAIIAESKESSYSSWTCLGSF